MTSIPVLKYDEPVILVGGGPVMRAALDTALTHAGVLIAADSGADRLAILGKVPEAIIGDMDSLSEPNDWPNQLGDRFIKISEQDTTDFDKCLYSIDAPLFLCLGMTGGRLDHSFSAFHTALRYPDKKLIFIDEMDAVKVMSNSVSCHLDIPIGSRISIIPLQQMRCLTSKGMVWPINQQRMKLGSYISVSNKTAYNPVSVAFDRTGATIILERSNISALI